MIENAKDKNIDELNELETTLKTELEVKFSHIPTYQNIYPYFIKPAVQKAREKWMDNQLAFATQNLDTSTNGK